MKKLQRSPHEGWPCQGRAPHETEAREPPKPAEPLTKKKRSKINKIKTGSFLQKVKCDEQVFRTRLTWPRWTQANVCLSVVRHLIACEITSDRHFFFAWLSYDPTTDSWAGFILVYRLTKICPGVPVDETCVTLVNRIIAWQLDNLINN